VYQVCSDAKFFKAGQEEAGMTTKRVRSRLVKYKQAFVY